MGTVYATLAVMEQHFGLTEIAGIATPDDMMTPSALAVRYIMEAGEETIQWPDWIATGEQAAAQACVDRANFALNVASKEIDSAIGIVYTLPVAESVINESILPSICCDLARLFLMDDKVTPEVMDRGKTARDWLRGVVDGKVVLAGAEKSSTSVFATPEYVAGPSVWDIDRW
jgi:phage gp36-like protein